MTDGVLNLLTGLKLLTDWALNLLTDGFLNMMTRLLTY